MKKKIIRITTVPLSLLGLLHGQLKFMSQHYEILGVSSQGKNNELDRLPAIEGVPAFAIEMTRKITPLKDIIAVYKLYRLFKKEKPFIVHSHTPKAGTLSMLAAKLAGVEHRLHTIAGLPLVEAKGLKRLLLNFVERATYSWATKIYPNSFGLKNIILEHNFTNKSKLTVIGNGSSNGIDIQRFDPIRFTDEDKKDKLREELGIKKSDFVFLFVGRLVSDKGVNELIEAFDKMCKNHSGIKLLLVGGYENELDPLKVKTTEIIKTNKNIVSSGWVEDVCPYFVLSNVLTFVSYREGFPNVVMQAGAMGLPCIVSNINGCNEIVIEGKNGTIIPVKDTNTLYNKMVSIFKGEIQFSSKTCRDLIVKRYQRQVIWDALLNEYDNLK
ncbi:glycosyltransferase family 4 protein [Hyunsoonleella ulvae]|uniref:glycosyltransferase family 4 protein n=1 Tax=Hyunsoonleella ulvae TaxID=2799948 RepID=UPI00193992EE|nr:glycosyltransferase family 4 protein [Hyunsoonleella ulvae]